MAAAAEVVAGLTLDPKWIFRCEASCGAIYEHPETDEDCPMTEGSCGHLVGSGWRPVRKTVVADVAGKGGRTREIKLFTGGGWLCPRCAATYLPEKRRRR